LPGQYGAERVTVQNLEVIRVETGQNMLAIRGAVPGPRGGLLTIKRSVKSR